MFFNVLGSLWINLYRMKLGFYSISGVACSEYLSGNSLHDLIYELADNAAVYLIQQRVSIAIVHELLKTNTQLIANKEAWEDPRKHRKIEQINALLSGSLMAMRKVGLKMNVAKENLGRVVLLLPSLKAPTTSGLYDENWFAVEAVVDRDIVRDLIPLLREAGAEGIIEYPLNKVL